MNPEDIVAALGTFCGSGEIAVRHGEDWATVQARFDPMSVELGDLFLILTADEVL